MTPFQLILKRVPLAVLLVGLTAPLHLSADEGKGALQKSTLLVQIRPEAEVGDWLARAMEQSMAHELQRYERIRVIDREGVDLRGCDVQDMACLLPLAGRAGIDVLISGTMKRGELAYQAFETWTPALVSSGTYRLPQDADMIGVKQHFLRLLRPFLKKGGILDQKSLKGNNSLYRVESLPTPDTDEEDHRYTILGGLFLLFALLSLLPLGLLGVWHGYRNIPRLSSLRTTRLAIPLFLASLALALRCWTNWWSDLPIDDYLAPSVHPLRSYVTTLEWLGGLTGGLIWGWFLLVVLRIVFPPLGGIERIGHRDVLRLTTAWCSVSAQRLLLIVVFYSPFGIACWWLFNAFPAHQSALLTLVIPTVGLLLRYWFLSLVECIAITLDAQLVEGTPSRDNPWHRDVAKYLQGYVNRTGWDMDQALLDRIVYLPGKEDEVLCYGGGLTHPRVVIGQQLLDYAIGAPEEAPQESNFVPWSEVVAGTVMSHAEQPPPERRRRAGGLHRSIGRWFRRDHSSGTRRPGSTGHPASRGKRNLGRAATNLGYVMPSPPGELVPLISDDTEDFKVVRELLAEHYAWFEGDPDSEPDDTDPTDKDFLFGVLVREIGLIHRQESQWLTLLEGISCRLRQRRPGLIPLLNRMTELYRRFFARPHVLLADGFAALNLAGHHLIQYLFHVGWWDQKEGMTARADGPQLHQTSTSIFRTLSEIRPLDQDRQYRRPTTRNRLVWLSQFFHTSLAEMKSRRLRIGTVVAVSIGLLLGAAMLVYQALVYHPVYLQQIAEQTTRLEETESQQHQHSDVPPSKEVKGHDEKRQ